MAGCLPYARRAAIARESGNRTFHANPTACIVRITSQLRSNCHH
jgi:hypothetical protein